MEYMAKREGIKVFMIDNMLTMNIQNQATITKKQAKLIINLKGLQGNLMQVIHLVAHPRKPALGQRELINIQLAEQQI